MKTRELVLKVTTGGATPEDYIAWAVSELNRGVDTPKLRVLAGLSPDFDRSEVAVYFEGAWEESGHDRSELISGALPAANAVRAMFDEGALSPDDCVGLMADLYAQSGYSEPRLWAWWELSEELAFDDPPGGGYFYPEVCRRPLAPVVLREWELFDLALSRRLNSPFRDLSYCESCGVVGVPVLVRISWRGRLAAALPWTRIQPARYPACSACSETQLRSLIDTTIREAYLESLPLIDVDQR